ncbi:MAG: SDR family oxidoreductase [Akkermansia sp.]|nr:SDR family oxidoreductase [Akkermansia sp.]
MKKFIKNILNTVLNKTGLRRVVYVYSNDKNYILPNHPVEGKLRGQNAFVTGANGALGRAITAVLISHGAKVYAVGRNKEKLWQLEEEMNQLHPNSCKACIANLENEAELSSAVKECLKENEKLDIWVNCAGGSAREKAKPIVEQEMDIIDMVITSNLRTCIIGCKIAASYMIKQCSGSIINISSNIVNRGKPAYSDYVATKAGVIGFTRNLALELGPSGIRVNSISPSFIQRGEYDQNQREYLLRTSCLNRIGTPEDVAHAVAFMASSEASFITAQNLLVDGARHLWVPMG